MVNAKKHWKTIHKKHKYKIDKKLAVKDLIEILTNSKEETLLIGSNTICKIIWLTKKQYNVKNGKINNVFWSKNSRKRIEVDE